MAYIFPDAHKIALRDALDAEGWDVEIQKSDEWWMNELWLVRSRWRPVGAAFHVSWIADPETMKPPTKVAHLCVGLAPARRADVGVEEFSLTWNWPKQLQGILAFATRFRDAAAQAG